MNPRQAGGYITGARSAKPTEFVSDPPRELDMMSRLSLFALLSWASLSAAADKNVVLMIADDLGRELGCYGDKVAKTPNIDALAAQGTRFTHAFCTTASCSPSRSVMFTGLHNHANGQLGLAVQVLRLLQPLEGPGAKGRPGGPARARRPDRRSCASPPRHRREPSCRCWLCN